MKTNSLRFLILLLTILTLGCDKIGSDTGDPVTTDLKPMGILDMAFIYRVQGIPAGRMKKVELSLAYTADLLYEGKFFIQANVSDAVTHYRFDLPPGDYFYYATVICLCGGDSCKYSGFPGQNGLIAAGGKVTVVEEKISSFATNFH